MIQEPFSHPNLLMSMMHNHRRSTSIRDKEEKLMIFSTGFFDFEMMLMSDF